MSEHFPKLLSRVDLLQKYVSVPSPTQDAALPGTEKQQPTNLSIAFTNMCPFPVKIALFQSYDPICACAVGWPQEPLERVLKISDSVDMQLPDGEKYIMKVYKPSVVDKELCWGAVEAGQNWEYHEGDAKLTAVDESKLRIY